MSCSRKKRKQSNVQKNGLPHPKKKQQNMFSCCSPWWKPWLVGGCCIAKLAGNLVEIFDHEIQQINRIYGVVIWIHQKSEFELVGQARLHLLWSRGVKAMGQIFEMSCLNLAQMHLQKLPLVLYMLKSSLQAHFGICASVSEEVKEVYKEEENIKKGEEDKCIENLKNKNIRKQEVKEKNWKTQPQKTTSEKQGQRQCSLDQNTTFPGHSSSPQPRSTTSHSILQWLQFPNLGKGPTFEGGFLGLEVELFLCYTLVTAWQSAQIASLFGVVLVCQQTVSTNIYFPINLVFAFEELLTGGCKKVQRLEIIPQLEIPAKSQRGLQNHNSIPLLFPSA
ncbi:hypothetical protein VP01_3387g1 [Puccinia sorghi]|uniref:Uncharacterized protein n=1 Tax=Puccinia sorghi TaxID=27349 RepID=A0A0L6UWS8_9BASI|nr:hypothetical protein VP01_3387g1 [Puccinia sorghi]